MIEEVAKWSAAGFPILRILLTAAVGMRGTKVVYPTTGCPEYYVRIDKEGTRLVFGDQFANLLEDVRIETKKQIRLSDLYKYADEEQV